MQVLTEKNSLLSKELEECKAQLQAALATAGEPKETPSGNISFE